MRRFVALLGFLGAAIFGGAFVASFVSPIWVESIARSAIQAEVERRVGERIESLTSGKIAQLASGIVARQSDEIAAARRDLAADLPKRVAEIVAQMGDIDCECRKAVVTAMSDGLAARIASLGDLNARLTMLIRGQYLHVAASLTREFRIFTGANAFVFGLLALAAMLRANARLQLLVPAVILFCAAVVVAYFYLFGQDWLHTIVFNDYVGFGYFAYLGIAFAFLADIILNRARVTTGLLNLALQAVGSTLQALPC